MSKRVDLKIKNKNYSLDLIEGSENEFGIDISNLRKDSKLITIDPGYKNTGSCKSDITFLDGEKGVLRYRGYSIEELAQKASFLEIFYDKNDIVIEFYYKKENLPNDVSLSKLDEQSITKDRTTFEFLRNILSNLRRRNEN